MRTPGSFLKGLREQKNYSLDRVSNETNISVNYITALENDDFEKFPGEPYLLGFLKTYADYLGVSHDQVLALYENYKRAEAPVPMHELLSKEKFKMPSWVWGLLLSLAVASSVAFLVIPYIQKTYQARQQKITDQEEVNQVKANVHNVDNKEYSGILRVGDSISVTFGERNRYTFVPIKMEGSTTHFEQQYNDNPDVTKFTIGLGEEKFFSLGGSVQANFVLKVLDIGLEDGKAITLRAQKLTRFSQDSEAVKAEAEKESVTGQPIPEGLVTSLQSSEIYAGKRRVILSMRSPVRIEVSLLFTGNTNFRYLLDGRESHERYYQEGDRFQRSMNSRFQLWTSNAGKTRLKIGLHEVVLGKDGEVVVKTLRWVYNASGGGYDLVLEDYN